MRTIFTNIEELKSVKEKRSKLSEREAELSAPRLVELDFIPEIYSFFNKLKGKQLEGYENVNARKQFIFIILSFYSPSALVGGRMVNGLRGKIAETLQITTKSIISGSCSEVSFLYQNYKDFRSEVDCLYGEIENWLKDKELIK